MIANVEFFFLLGTVLARAIWQRMDYHQLPGRIDTLNEDLTGCIDRSNSELSTRIDRISDDLRQFLRELGRHDKAIEIWSADRSPGDRAHSDVSLKGKRRNTYGSSSRSGPVPDRP